MHGNADFRWGLIGPGGIAHRFAQAVQTLPGSRLAALWGRDCGQAQSFATRWTVPDRLAPVVHRDVDGLLADPDIDAVYIATPHTSHAEFALRALDAGRPVLCEKPLAPTLALSTAMVERSVQRGVFLMEALWTRFLPAYVQVAEWLGTGAIGSVRAVQSSFCFAVPYAPASRLFNPALGGGSLLDIGIYNLAMSRWVLQAERGECPEVLDIRACGVLAPSGVDMRVSASLRFAGEVTAQFVCAFDTVADNSLHILGSKGAIRVPETFWEGRCAQLLVPQQPTVTVQTPLRINGFEEEIDETQRCVRAGLLQSPRMPHAESLALARDLGVMRRQLGVCYPFD